MKTNTNTKGDVWHMRDPEGYARDRLNAAIDRHLEKLPVNCRSVSGLVHGIIVPNIDAILEHLLGEKDLEE